MSILHRCVSRALLLSISLSLAGLRPSCTPNGYQFAAVTSFNSFSISFRVRRVDTARKKIKRQTGEQVNRYHRQLDRWTMWFSHRICSSQTRSTGSWVFEHLIKGLSFDISFGFLVRTPTNASYKVFTAWYPFTHSAQTHPSLHCHSIY